MKLNVKKTILIGLAFFSIGLFWQVYDSVLPKILTTHFGLNQTLSGLVMGLDNLIALFIIPVFGALSDRTKSKWGRRTPYIAIGTALSIVMFITLSFVDNAQINRIEQVDMYKSDTALITLWEEDLDVANPKYNAIKKIFKGEDEPKEVKLSSLISKEEFLNIKATNSEGKPTQGYIRYVVPARTAYAKLQTSNNPFTLVIFILILLTLLLSMAMYRSPAVALMPDVTIKPNRAKANSIINLLGAVAAGVIIVLGFLFKTGQGSNTTMSYTFFFSAAAALMAIAIIIFLLTVNEPKLVKEKEEAIKKYKIDDKDEDFSGDKKLSKERNRSLILLLLTSAFAYMGFNALNSKYTVYAEYVLHIDYNTTLMFAMVVAIISFVPIGYLSDKVGRKQTALFGIAGLAVLLSFGGLLDSTSPSWIMNTIFSLAGVCWAAIQVNAYPMVVELSKGSNVGKYTGYYYAATMTAQFLTPILSGIFMDLFGFRTLFPYAAICVGIAMLMLLGVKHGDYKRT